MDGSSLAQRLEQRTKSSSLDGCPMFALAYMGRKDGSQPLPPLLLDGQTDCGQEEEPLCVK
jgi:hypothetical protein